jgi:hypothetical protein
MTIKNEPFSQERHLKISLLGRSLKLSNSKPGCRAPAIHCFCKFYQLLSYNELIQTSDFFFSLKKRADPTDTLGVKLSNEISSLPPPRGVYLARLTKKIRFRSDHQISKIKKNRSDQVSLQKSDQVKDQVSLKSPR